MIADTSVLVRYLTGQPAETARKVARRIEAEAELVVPTVVLAETAYVLNRVYSVPRAQLVEALQALILRANVRVPGLTKVTLVEAFELCRPSALTSFADALIWAEARCSGRPVLTLDHRFPDRDLDLRHL